MTIGERIKKAIGVEGSTSQALLPMLAYNSFHISSAGASYLTSLYYSAFLTYVEGLSLAQAGTVLLFKSLWDAAIDPFIGLLTDRTRSRMGKHRIYIFFAAIPFGITYFMLWTSFGASGSGRSNTIILYYIFANVLFTTANSFIYVPHNAMLPELAPGYFQRTQYISMGYLMNSTGMFPSFLVAGAFLGMIKTQEFNAELRPVFLKMGLLLGVVYILPILATAIFTKEKSSKDMVVQPVDGKYVIGEYKQVFKNKAFVQYFAISFLLMFGTAFFANSKTYFIYEIADAKQYLNLLVFWAGIAEMTAFVPNYALTKKFGKAKMAWFTLPFLFVSLALSFVIGRQTGTGIPWMVVALFAQEMLYPFGISGISFAIQNISPDVTDVDEMVTGRRREGVIAAINNFIKISTGGLLQFLVGIILEWFGVSVKDAQGNAKPTMFSARATSLFGSKLGGPSAGLRLVHGALPMMFTLLSMLALRKYTMTRDEHKRIREAIALKHAQQNGEALPENIPELTEAEQQRLSEIAGLPWESMWIGS